MASVWETRWANFVRGLFALRESTTLGHLPDLMPTVQVNDPVAAEAYLLRRERQWRYPVSLAAAVGFGGTLELENPTGTGVLLVIDSMGYFVTGATDVRARVIASGSGVAGLASGQAYTVDPRGSGVAPASPILPRADSAHGVVAAAPQVLWHQNAATTWNEQDINTVIPPGNIFQFWVATANIGLLATVRYRIRSVDPSELGNQGA